MYLPQQIAEFREFLLRGLFLELFFQNVIFFFDEKYVL